MKTVRNIIEIDEERCTGCGQCVVSCAEGAIAIIDGKAKVIRDSLCDGLGACIGSCPEDALKIIQREADAFDEEEVHRHLHTQKSPVGCPGSAIRQMAPAAPIQESSETRVRSQLGHWPVQIHLVPAHAPFLKNADLLILADCAAVVYAGLHYDLLPGKVVMMGCPKFDNGEAYMRKFQDIFTQSGVRSVTVARMEVPCCKGISAMVERALSESGMQIPLETVVIRTSGEILDPAMADRRLV